MDFSAAFEMLKDFCNHVSLESEQWLEGGDFSFYESAEDNEELSI